MVFADDERESNPTSFKFLQMAHAWKAKQAAGGGTNGTESAGSGLFAGFAKATETETDRDGDNRMSSKDDDNDDADSAASSDDE
jgi:crooked neck